MKSEGKASRAIAKELSVSELTVNRWVKRYLSDGLNGLQNKAGQGRKPIMDAFDEKIVIAAIEKDRLSVMEAKERWQNATGKKLAATHSEVFYPPWRKIWTNKKTSKEATLAAAL